MGKSSTVNSLLNERVANVAALQSDVSRPQVIARAADGFTLTLIDTPGLLEADAVSDAVRRPCSQCSKCGSWLCSRACRAGACVAASPGVGAEAGQRSRAASASFFMVYTSGDLYAFLIVPARTGEGRQQVITRSVS